MASALTANGLLSKGCSIDGGFHRYLESPTHMNCSSLKFMQVVFEVTQLAASGTVLRNVALDVTKQDYEILQSSYQELIVAAKQNGLNVLINITN